MNTWVAGALGLMVICILGFWLLAGHTNQTKNHLGPEMLYPNAAYTPGDVQTTDAYLICHRHTREVRKITRAQERRIFARYGVAYPAPHGAYEFDHFIPLELGGSNDDKNLWPEPALPSPGFHQKDLVENYLHRQVCAGEISLREAQRKIAADWYAVYLQIR